MRTWNLQRGDPLSLTIAADARLCHPEFSNDQIWELLLGTGDPAAILVQTSYGLRARNMRLFLRFAEAEKVISDPKEFDKPPVVEQFFPNYLRLALSPLAGIEVATEFWVPESNLLAGRVRLKNSGVLRRRFSLEMAGLLNPLGEGTALRPGKLEAVNILHGQTENLTPVVFFTGGPESSGSPYPALVQRLDLRPGQARQFTWVHAALPEIEDSFQLARHTATRNWEAEIAKVEMTNAGGVDIETGDTEWDAAFALGQKAALGLIHGPTGALKHRSFVLNRLPEQGYSALGDGSDYTHLWNGQTAFDLWYLTGQLLPGDADLAKEILLNFLEAQDAEGRIPWKVGLNGQHSRMLATPILAEIAWRIYECSEDEAFLQTAFPKLLEFVQAWFAKPQDRDEDGVPEWDHPMQSGFEDNPLFARWHKWDTGADISMYESPALCAFLYRECRRLVNMARLLGNDAAIPPLEARTDSLKAAVQAAWDTRGATFRYWDRETHHSEKGKVLGRRKGPGEIRLDISFDQPTRLHMRLECPGDRTLRARVSVHGTAMGGKQVVEVIERDKFLWFEGLGTFTGERLYKSVEEVEIEGIPQDCKVYVETVDTYAHDLTQLLPLWAGMVDEKQADVLIRRGITNPKRYWRKYGLPACPTPPRGAEEQLPAAVWYPWNALVGEGMLKYGARKEAAELVSQMMKGIVRTLKRQGAFRKHHLADSGEAMGERDTLGGLPTRDLFLQTLGVRIISPWKVSLDGFNPYPWPVKIKYRGAIVECLSDKNIVTFPDGQSITVDEPSACLVTSEKEAIRPTDV